MSLPKLEHLTAWLDIYSIRKQRHKSKLVYFYFIFFSSVAAVALETHESTFIDCSLFRVRRGSFSRMLRLPAALLSLRSASDASSSRNFEPSSAKRNASIRKRWLRDWPRPGCRRDSSSKVVLRLECIGCREIGDVRKPVLVGKIFDCKSV